MVNSKVQVWGFQINPLAKSKWRIRDISETLKKHDCKEL